MLTLLCSCQSVKYEAYTKKTVSVTEERFINNKLYNRKITIKNTQITEVRDVVEPSDENMTIRYEPQYKQDNRIHIHD